MQQQPLIPTSPPIHKDASISSCGTYRWSLERSWGPGRRVCFMMLNPSDANAERNDPTVLRSIDFTQRWGFDRFDIVNAIPFRSPSPAKCKKWFDGAMNQDWYARDALQENLHKAIEIICKADLVVAAWGATGWAQEWIELFLEEIQTEYAGDISCLGTNQDGSPKHPLARGRHRVPNDQQPILWKKS